jgi:hypothetical protein
MKSTDYRTHYVVLSSLFVIFPPKPEFLPQTFLNYKFHGYLNVYC